jgi:hypothetical protein
LEQLIIQNDTGFVHDTKITDEHGRDFPVERICVDIDAKRGFIVADAFVTDVRPSFKLPADCVNIYQAGGFAPRPAVDWPAFFAGAAVGAAYLFTFLELCK